MRNAVADNFKNEVNFSSFGFHQQFQKADNLIGALEPPFTNESNVHLNSCNIINSVYDNAVVKSRNDDENV